MTDTAANRKFFKSILHQTLEGRSEKSIHGNLGVIEAVHWARLGAQVGYLEKNDVPGLLSFASTHIFDAWSALRTGDYFSADHPWANIFQEQKGGWPKFNEHWFTVGEIAEAKSEFLQGMYQTLLLLWTENILDESSRFFLDMVTGASESDWRSLMSGNRPDEHGNVQTIGIGLANVLNYWAEVESLLNDPIAQPKGRQPFAEIIRARGWKERIVEPILSEIIAFGRDVQRIVRFRFNLGTIELVERYFAVAGEFVNGVGDNSPAWLDARLAAFQTLIWQVTVVGGGEYMFLESDRERLWFAFRRGVEVFQISTTETLSEPSSEKTRVRSPKESL